MYKIKMLLCGVAVSAAMMSPAGAATHIVEIVDVQPQILYAVDLGALCEHITDVTMRAVGVGGRGRYVCEAPATGGWYDLDFVVYFENGHIAFPTQYAEPYDVTATAVVTEGNWQPCEGDAACPVGWDVEPHGFANFDWRTYCGLEEWDVAPISRLIITVTTDEIVAAEGLSWGAVKSRYR